MSVYITKLRMVILNQPEPAYVIAMKAGIPGTRISEYQHGKRNIPKHHVIPLAIALGVNPEDIVGYMEVPDMEEIMLEAG